MKNFFTTILCLLVSNFGFAQNAGINNSNPAQALQVSGSGTGTAQPIIRIDGLNAVNNTANDATLKKVFATATGDLVIAAANQTNQYLTTGKLPTMTISGGETKSIITKTFTLYSPSIVHFECKVAVDIGSTNPYDGKARLYGVYYQFTAAPSGVATSTAFGRRTSSYGASIKAGSHVGSFYINPRQDLSLPAGNYTVALMGYSQSSDMPILIDAANQTNQYMRITITPVSF